MLAGKHLPQPLPAITKALNYPDQVPTKHQLWQPQRVGFQPFPFEFHRRARRVVSRLDPAEVHRELVDDRFIRAALDRAGGPNVLGLPDLLTAFSPIFRDCSPNGAVHKAKRRPEFERFARRPSPPFSPDDHFAGPQSQSGGQVRAIGPRHFHQHSVQYLRQLSSAVAT
jgi:hypothetical protein